MPITVLVFHDIAETPHKYAVTAKVFSAYVRKLAEASWKIASIETALSLPKGKQAQTVCFTFDDGYLSVIKHAVPVLQEYNFSATVYVAPEHVGRSNAWNRRSSLRLQHCDWEQLQACLDAGWTIGHHSYGHFNNRAQNDEELRGDIEKGFEVFKEQLGIVPKTYAYPYGSRDERVKRIVGEYFTAALATERGSDDLGLSLDIRRVWPEIMNDNELLRLWNLACG